MKRLAQSLGKASYQRALLASCLALVCLLWPANVLADNTATTSLSDLSISPAVVQIKLDASQNSTVFDVTVSNNSSQAVSLAITTNDFSTLNQRGGISFLGSNYSGDQLHGLANWMHPISPEFTLKAKTSQSVPILISNVNQLAPGGHYGVVVFRAVPTNPSKNGNQFSTQGEVSVLVFLTTAGGQIQSIKLQPLGLGKIFTSLPSMVNVVFSNNGNTQVTPRGLVTITNEKGQETGRGIIDIESGMILPNTERLYQVSMKYSQKIILAGSYHLNIIYRANDGAKQSTFTHNFLFINRNLVTIIILGLLIPILVVWYLTGQSFRQHLKNRR